MNERRQSGWINRPRVRAHALMLALVLWLAYGVDLATPALRDRFGHLKGADFLHGYVLGSLALEHRPEALYDPVAQAEESVRRVPESKGDYFLPVYGPQYSLLYAPFAALPYGWAAVLWIGLSATLYGLCCWAVWRTCPNLAGEGATVMLLAVAFPGFFALVSFGMNAAIALAAFTGAYFALRSQRWFVAGLCFGVLAYKPQLGLLVAGIFLLTGAWKVVAGAVLSAAAQFLVAALYYGPGVLREYVKVLRGIGSAAPILEPKLYHMHCLRAFWKLLLPWGSLALVLYAASAVAVAVIAVLCWRARAPLGLRYAVLLLGTVLIAPHLTIYDLVLLAPALLLIADWLLACGDSDPATYARIKGLLYWTFALPLLGPLARWTHLQLSVIAMAALLIAVARVIRHGGPEKKEAAEPKTVLASSSG